VLARCPPLAKRPPFDTSQTLLFSKTGKNSGFSKKPGKRRLARSTQFSRNRTPGVSSPRMTPSHRRSFRTRLPSEDGNSNPIRFCPPCQWFRCPAADTSTRMRD
jgi:hypothetical protein